MPPIGVKATVLSATRARLTWTDTTLRSQRVQDSRFYVVRYNPKLARKQRFVNSTQLTVELFDLRPDTEYEFSVKVVKGQRRSTWSLSVFNRTMEAGNTLTHANVCLICLVSDPAVSGIMPFMAGNWLKIPPVRLPTLHTERVSNKS